MCASWLAGWQFYVQERIKKKKKGTFILPSERQLTALRPLPSLDFSVGSNNSRALDLYFGAQLSTVEHRSYILPAVQAWLSRFVQSTGVAFS